MTWADIMALNGLVLCGLFFAYAGGRKDGRRLYQIELRIALHQGRDIGEMVESDE